MTASLSYSLAACVAVTSVVCWTFPSLTDTIALVPAYTLPPNTYVWNLATCIFVEPNIWWLALDIAILVGVGHTVVEAHWGSVGFPHSFRTYVLLNAVITNLLLLVTAVVAYASGFQYFLFQRYGGFLPSSIAVAVVAGRVVPLSESASQWVPGLPWAVLAVAVISAIIFPNATPTETDISYGNVRPKGSHLLQALASCLTSLLYCRIYAPLKPSLDELNDIPSVVCSVSLSDTAMPQPQVRPLPGSNNVEADRRRQVALAALAARLKKIEEEDTRGTLD